MAERLEIALVRSNGIHRTLLKGHEKFVGLTYYQGHLKLKNIAIWRLARIRPGFKEIDERERFYDLRFTEPDQVAEYFASHLPFKI